MGRRNSFRRKALASSVFLNPPGVCLWSQRQIKALAGSARHRGCLIQIAILISFIIQCHIRILHPLCHRAVRLWTFLVETTAAPYEYLLASQDIISECRKDIKVSFIGRTFLQLHISNKPSNKGVHRQAQEVSRKSMSSHIFFCHNHNFEGGIHHKQAGKYRRRRWGFSSSKDPTDGAVSSSFQQGLHKGSHCCRKMTVPIVNQRPKCLSEGSLFIIGCLCTYIVQDKHEELLRSSKELCTLSCSQGGEWLLHTQSTPQTESLWWHSREDRKVIRTPCIPEVKDILDQHVCLETFGF